MKPGHLNLPAIYRGSDYFPIVFRWLRLDGTPASLVGWTPIAKSQSINFNPVITDFATSSTQISFTKEQTSQFKLGVEEWDWVWVHVTGRRQGPYLSGSVEVKEPASNT